MSWVAKLNIREINCVFSICLRRRGLYSHACVIMSNGKVAPECLDICSTCTNATFLFHIFGFTSKIVLNTFKESHVWCFHFRLGFQGSGCVFGVWLTAIKGGKTSQIAERLLAGAGPCLTVPAGIWDKYTWEVQLQSFHLICERRCGCLGNDEPWICNRGRRPNKLLLKAYGLGKSHSPALFTCISSCCKLAHVCYSHLWNAVGFYMLCSTWNHIRLQLESSHKAGRERVVWCKLGSDVEIQRCVGTRATGSKLHDTNCS